MNIFVAGIHGVGKTFLAAQLCETLDFTHASASKLIKEERALPHWNSDKRVSDVDANQVALAAAVIRYNCTGCRLLLDGHFVLLDENNKFVHLSTEVFRPLNLDGVILLEAEPTVISTRILQRDGRQLDSINLAEFINTERAQAKLVCDELGIRLCILNSADIETFTKAVEGFL